MEDEDILARVGTFLVLIASFLIIMFVASDMAKMVKFDLFFVGVFIGAAGLFLRRRAPSPPPSGRFEAWRKMRSGERKEKQAEKQAKHHEEHAD